MDEFFKNKSQLGAFGEFAYKRFCEKQGHSAERTNYCHTDFLVTHKGTGKQLYVDVKTSCTAVNGYKSKRFGEDIVYETILVSGGVVTLIPDAGSFFHDIGRKDLGAIDQLVAEWRGSHKPKATRKRIISDEAFSKLKAAFSISPYPRFRLVERGDASSKRWTGTVDNLPGSTSTQNKFDATVFVQYGCLNFQQHVSKVMLIPHRLLLEHRVKMTKPSQRQSKKKISEVMDLVCYECNFPEYVFEGLDQLVDFVEAAKH